MLEDYNINYAPKRNRTGLGKHKRIARLKLTNPDNNRKYNDILRMTGNPEGEQPILKEKSKRVIKLKDTNPAKRRPHNDILRMTGNPEGEQPILTGRHYWPTSYDPVISSIMDVNHIAPGRLSSLHPIEAQANYNAGMPIIEASGDFKSRYDQYGDWSQFTKPVPGKFRLPEGTDSDAARLYGMSGAVRINNYNDDGNINATMNLGDLFTDMHLVPGHLPRSIKVSKLLMDRIGLARTNAARKYIGNVGILNEGEKAPEREDYRDSKSFREDDDSYQARHAATLLNSIYDDSTHPLTRPIIAYKDPLSPGIGGMRYMRGQIDKGYSKSSEGDIIYLDKYPEELMQYRRTGDVPIRFTKSDPDGSFYAFTGRGDTKQTPFINIEASDRDWDNEKYRDNSDTLTSGLIYYSNAINEYPINITDYSAGLQPSLLIYDPGAVMHEGIHGMTNRIYGPSWERPSNIYADLYGTSDDNTYLKYKKKNIERPGYTLKNSAEALRSHRVLKTAFARDLIHQGLTEEEVVNRVQDPLAFLQWLDTTVYNGGEGGGFSFPDGIVPRGGEEEYHRAAVGFRPVVGELLDKVKQYNSWQNNDNMPDRLKILTFPANPLFSELPSEERLKVFGEVHPQVRNTRSNNIYNYLS